MAFCKNCGQQLLEDSEFCHKCGTPVNGNNEDNANDATQRKQSYVGEVKKCPSCGMELSSMTAICPACGHEINSAVVYPALAEFIDSLNSCEHKIADAEHQKQETVKGWRSWGSMAKFLWVVLNILTFCIPLIVYLSINYYIKNAIKATPFGKEKTKLIENFQIPNEKEAIVETLYFIQSKINALSVQKVTFDNLYWIKLWHIKAMQIYQKALILLPGEKITENVYLDVDNKTKKLKYTAKINTTFTAVFMFVYILFVYKCVEFIIKSSAVVLFEPSIYWLFLVSLLFIFLVWASDKVNLKTKKIFMSFFCIAIIVMGLKSWIADLDAEEEEMEKKNTLFSQTITSICDENNMKLTKFSPSRNSIYIDIQSQTYEKETIDKLEKLIVDANTDFGYKLYIDINDVDDFIIRDVHIDEYGIIEHLSDNTNGFISQVKSVCKENNVQLKYINSHNKSVYIDIKISQSDNQVLDKLENNILSMYKDFEYSELSITTYDENNNTLRKTSISDFGNVNRIYTDEFLNDIYLICNENKIELKSFYLSNENSISIDVRVSGLNKNSIKKIEKTIIKTYKKFEYDELILDFYAEGYKAIRTTTVDKSGNVNSIDIDDSE